jgi:hypothetical protein
MLKLWKFKIAGLHVLQVFMNILSLFFYLLALIAGSYFAIAIIAEFFVLVAAIWSIIIIVVSNFYMSFIALFKSSLWMTMGGMWTWMWSWLKSSTILIWPHIIKPVLPSLILVFIVMVIENIIDWLRRKQQVIKLMSFGG